MNRYFSKLVLSLSLAGILLCIPSRPVQAVDLTVTCADNGPCTTSPSSGAALFTETNWLPGDSVNRTITVINQDSDDTCNLTLDTENETQTPSDFATRLFTVIKKGVTDLFGVRNGATSATNDKTLNDVYNFGTLNLGSIAPSSSQTFDWAVAFDFAAGNEYQNAQTVFDFDLVFTCDGVATPSPTPTLSPAGPPGPSGGGTSGGSVLGAFTSSLAKTFRSVFGTTEEEIFAASPTPTPEPEVKGEETVVPADCGKYFRWWIPLVIEAIAILLYILFVMWKKKDETQLKRFIILPLLAAIASQIAHIIIGCPCVDTVWCKWYWAFNLIIVLITVLLYQLLLAKRKETS